MEITLLQGILLTIMTIIVGLDFFLEAFFIFRPLIVSTLTGLILGDITLGLKVGALIELAFAGLTPACLLYTSHSTRDTMILWHTASMVHVSCS